MKNKRAVVLAVAAIVGTWWTVVAQEPSSLAVGAGLRPTSGLAGEVTPLPRPSYDPVAVGTLSWPREGRDTIGLRTQVKRTDSWLQRALRQRGGRYAFGVHAGIDLGGAVPWPPANLRADAMKMSAVPKLNPSLGLSFTAFLPKRFSLSAELTYKQVGIDAEAWVSGQQFRLPNPDGEDMITRFRGTANVVMDFSMLEIPVYVGYGFNGGRSRVYLGAYYSYILKSNFDTKPLKGLVTSSDGSYIMVTPDSPIPPDAMPVFNDYLDCWDVGMLLGYEWQIVPRLKMTARFSMGFKDIFRPGSNYLEYRMLHMRGTIAISYTFLRFNDNPFKKHR